MSELEKQVIAAVQTLYTDFDEHRRRDADRWLIEFQTTQEAWGISFSLLCSDVRSTVKRLLMFQSLQKRYFGIQTLYHKVSKQWNSLEVSQKKELVIRLLPLLSDLANDPVVLSKVCSTLCQIILQSLSDVWNNPIDDLIQRFSSNTVCQPAILQVLAYLAEGVLDLNVPEVKKKEVEEYLKSYSGKVFDLVLQILQKKTNEKLCVRALQCLNSWFQFYLPVGQIIVSPFIPLLFEYITLRDESLVAGAADILKEVFSADISRYNSSKQVVLFAINRLIAICRESLHEINMCHVCSLCITVANPMVIIKEAGESGLLFFSCLLSFCTNDFGLIGDLLTCFHDIQDALRNNEECTESDKNRFKPLFISFVEQIIRLFVYPPNFEEFQYEYAELRSQLSINLLFVYYLFPDCLAVLQQALDASLGSPNWTHVEACLSCFLAVADGVPEDENVYIPHLFRSLEKINWNHTLLIKTAIKLVGRYTVWLSNNERSLTLKLVNFIVPFLADPNLCPYSAESLLSLSEMKSDYLLDVIGLMLPQCEATMKTMKAENKSIVLSALCNIVVRLENANDCSTIVGGLAAQTIADLRSILQTQNGDQMNALVENIDCLCAIVKSADTESQPHPLTKVVADSWEVLILLFNKFCAVPGQETRATEPMCSLFSHFILSLKKQFLQYLESLEATLFAAYTKNLSPSILNTFNIIAVVFDTDEFNPYIRVTLDVIVTTVNSLPSNLDLMPDTIASLFKLASQLIQRKRTAGLLGETAFVTALLGFTLRVCIEVKERNAGRSAFKFLSTFLSLESPEAIEHVKNYVNSFMKDFIAVIMKNLSSSSSETIQKGCGELLYQLLSLSHPALVKNCINDHLKLVNKENNEPLQALLSQIIREKNKQNFRKLTSQFASLLSNPV